MSHVLIVDDSATDRKLAGRLLEKQGALEVRYAEHGQAALDRIADDPPDLVVSDLQMPLMNGLELVEAVRREYPSVPIILMTAQGSEQIAAEALRRGAASYVPKSHLAQQLCETAERILQASHADRLHSRLMHSLEEESCVFRLHNDPGLIEPLMDHVQELLRCLPLRDQSERLRVAVAVKHALWIAHHHGNLELPLDVDWDDEGFAAEAARKRILPGYSGRTIEFRAQFSREQAVFTITHDGPGIDWSKLPRDLELRAADQAWLSGFLMLPAVMDDVTCDRDRRSLSLLKKACVDSALECNDDEPAG